MARTIEKGKNGNLYIMKITNDNRVVTVFYSPEIGDYGVSVDNDDTECVNNVYLTNQDIADINDFKNVMERTFKVLPKLELCK